MWVCLTPAILYGQALSGTKDVKHDTVPFLKRWSIMTNAVDWVVATPNLGVEFDLAGNEKTRFSILMNGKYNWNTHHSIQPRIVYNVAVGSVEARKYWRTGGSIRGAMERYTKDTRDTTISLPLWGFRRFRRNVLSGRTFMNPRVWRAYYVGVYAGYEKYTISLGRKGKQGDSYNFGFTGGWSVPLYPFKDGRSVDLDLGLAVGAKMTAYDKFGYDEEYGCYTYQGSKGRHIVPFPVVQDIHLSFVFRFRSIGKKVQGGAERYDEWDTRQKEKRNERSRVRQRNWEIRDSMYKVRRKEAEAEKFSRDSLRRTLELNDSLEDVAKEKAKAEEKAEAEAGEKGKSRRKRKGKKTEGEEQVTATPQAATGNGTSETPSGSAKADTPEDTGDKKKASRKEKRRKKKNKESKEEDPVETYFHIKGRPSGGYRADKGRLRHSIPEETRKEGRV